MKVWRMVAILLVCLVLVSLTACGQAEESQQQIVEVSRGDIVVSVAADGNLSLPWHRKLTFGTSGTVAEVNVEQGDRVTAGQVLANLDTISLELAVKIAEIDLELAANDFREITYPYTYHTLVLDIPASIVAIRDAQRQLKEAQEALEIGLSFEQYWEVWHQLKQAQDNLVEASSRLARGRGAGVFGSGIIPITDYWTLRAAELEMEKAQLDLDKAKDDLEKTVIVAPFDGVIARANIKEGDNLSSLDYATKIIFELIDPSRMELNAEVDEIDIPGVKLGQRVIISIDALPDVEFEGVVTFISPLAEEEAGVVLYEVKIGFDVPEGSELKTGMSATADIVIEERSDVLLVPDRAIKQDSQGNPVVEVVLGEQTQERPVVIGISDGYQTEIVDGLNEGEMVMVEFRLKPKSNGLGLF